MLKEQNLTEGNIAQYNDADLEQQLLNLRAAYMDMKKERVRTEKDTQLLENKLKMLQSEELKAYKNFTKEKKFKEEWEAARQRTQEFKNELMESKIKRKQESYEMSIKIKEMRENIQRSLNDKKMMKFQENRLNNLQLKQKKIEGDEVRKEKVKEEIEKAKRIAENVKTREKNFQVQKKQNEIEKMLKMKQELEQKILEEEMKKLQFEVKFYLKSE